MTRKGREGEGKRGQGGKGKTAYWALGDDYYCVF